MATQSRLPTGDGGTLQHTASAGNRFECVDDPIGTPDDDSTYIFRTANNATTTFTFTAFDITSSAIEKVSVTYRRQNATGSSFDRGAVLVSAVLRESTSEATPGSYGERTVEWTTNPATGSAWTEAEVEAITEFGVRNLATASGEFRCTQCYITVTYTEAAGGGGSTLRKKRRMLMGIG